MLVQDLSSSISYSFDYKKVCEIHVRMESGGWRRGLLDLHGQLKMKDISEAEKVITV